MMHLPPACSAPLPCRRLSARASARYGPAASDDSREDLPPADTERTVPVLIQQRLTDRSAGPLPAGPSKCPCSAVPAGRGTMRGTRAACPRGWSLLIDTHIMGLTPG